MSFRVKKVIKLPHVGDIVPLCVGCATPVNPGFCYTGSVLAGIVFKTISSFERTPIEVVHNYPDPFLHVVGGGELIESIKRIGFYKRKKGFLCDSCASNYHTIEDKRGNKHELVKVDERPGFVKESSHTGELKSFRKGPAFNTRYTQGKRGRRV